MDREKCSSPDPWNCHGCYLWRLLGTGWYNRVRFRLDPERARRMPIPGRTSNPFFALTAFSTALFVVTILALVAAMLGDPRAPINRFLEAYAGGVIAVEVLAILLTGFVALALDRRQTLAAIRHRTPTENRSLPDRAGQDSSDGGSSAKRS